MAKPTRRRRDLARAFRRELADMRWRDPGRFTDVHDTDPIDEYFPEDGGLASFVIFLSDREPLLSDGVEMVSGDVRDTDTVGEVLLPLKLAIARSTTWCPERGAPMRISEVSICTFLCLATSAVALPLKEVKKYDLNENGVIDPGMEEDYYILHIGNPILRNYDNNPLNGRLDPAEVAEIEKVGRTMAYDAATETAQDFALVDLEAGIRNVEELADPPAPRRPKGPQRIFLRRNRLDVSVFNKAIDKKAAEGAEIVLSRNWETDETIFSVDGFLTYVLARNRTGKPRPGDSRGPYFSGYALAPYMQFKRKTNSKAIDNPGLLALGAAAQLELARGPIFNEQIFTFEPSYQTDFQGDAQIYSGKFTWEPYNVGWHIGLGERRILFTRFVEYTVQVFGDVDYRFVRDPGQTGLGNESQFWAGGGIRPTFWLWPEALNSKLYVILEETFRYDLVNSARAQYFQASLNWNLDRQGLSSVKVAYQRGHDYQLAKDLNQIELRLGVKF